MFFIALFLLLVAQKEQDVDQPNVSEQPEMSNEPTAGLHSDQGHRR